jgi:hypothetical protein
MKPKNCKICSESFVPLRSLQMVCSTLCAREYTNRQKAKEWNKEKVKRKKDLMTVQDWLKIAQQTFNAYIRERDKGKPCISCGNDKPKKVNAGHFFSSGGHKAVTFDEQNVHLQCEYCNTYLSGNLINYRKGLIQRIGEDGLEQLEQRANATAKFTREELQELTKEYKQKIKQLKNKEQ